MRAKQSALKPVLVLAIVLVGAAGLLDGCRSHDRIPGSQQVVPAQQMKSLRSAQGTFQAQYITRPDPIPLNEPFDIEVHVTRIADGSRVGDEVSLEVDGRMPHHRHGMNRQPTVTSRGNGEFLIQNMLFHMPGRWEIYFDITSGGQTERAQDVVFLD